MKIETHSPHADRMAYLDHLRVAATFFVVLLHVSSQNWHIVDVNSRTWLIMNLYDSLTRWAIPVFIMISGALFLGREFTIRELYSKYIFRMLTAYLFWGLFYALVYATPEERTFLNIFSKMLYGHYHMWFIPMIAGMYICVPIFKRMVACPKTTSYFLLVSFFACFVFPQISQMIKDFAPDQLISYGYGLENILINMDLSPMAGLSFYFVAGYVFSNAALSKKERLGFSLLGVFGFVLLFLLSTLASRRFQIASNTYYSNTFAHTLWAGIAVFQLFRDFSPMLSRLDPIMKVLSKYCFGIFLTHVFILDVLQEVIGLDTLSFSPIFSIPLITILVFLLSLAVSWIMKQIPIIKKYII